MNPEFRDRNVPLCARAVVAYAAPMWRIEVAVETNDASVRHEVVDAVERWQRVASSVTLSVHEEDPWSGSVTSNPLMR